MKTILKTPFFILVLIASIMIIQSSVTVYAELITTSLDSLSTSKSTGEKPQSKVWTYDGQWWCVLPTNSAARSTGTWVWKLHETTWVEALKLSDAIDTKADIKKDGSIVHILLYGSNPELFSIEYVDQAYQLWEARSAPSVISLPSSEIASIDIDSTGRMWLASESENDIIVHYSDSPYNTWSSAISLASDVSSDDICVVTAMPNNTIGVLWSDQVRKQFGFRVHTDGTAATVWSADEIPAFQSALTVGGGMVDDHLNVAVASDGTLYAVVKTDYDTIGSPEIALLVRRPAGTWDDLYEVDTLGTRGIVLLNEFEKLVTVIYTASDGYNNILYKESPTSAISFGASQILMSDSLNDVTSMKENYTDEVVILASTSNSAIGVLTQVASPVTQRLVAHWAMEENGGDILIDSSENENNATLAGEPNWINGIAGGYALVLNGFSQFGTVSHEPSLNATDNEITIAAWIKPEVQATQRIVRKVGTSSGYSLFLSANGYVSIKFNDSNVYRANTIANYPTDGSTWLHVAATYDGTDVKMYINGIEDDLLTHAASGFTIVNNTSDLSIGVELPSSNIYKGQIDDIRIYNYALSTTEIETLADLNSEPPTLTLLSPNGGEQLSAGTLCPITWNTSGITPVVTLDYSINNGSNWTPIDTVMNTDYYQWDIPEINSQQCLLRITNPTYPASMDMSDDVFTLFVCTLLHDLNGDCLINLLDMALLATEWLDCGNPFNSDCSP